MLAGPVTVFDGRLPVCISQLPFLCRGGGGRTRVYRLPFQRLIRPRGYAPVGHLGVEPSYTALSERPLRPDGPWPMNLARRRGGCYALPVPGEEDGGVEPHGVTRREGSGPAAAPAAHLPRAESGGHDPQRQDADPPSKRSRSLIGSLSISTVPGIRTPNTRALNAV